MCEYDTLCIFVQTGILFFFCREGLIVFIGEEDIMFISEKRI